MQEEIALAIVEALRKSARVEDWAAAVMPLVKRAQAEALREAADGVEAAFADPDRRRPRHPRAEVPTDYVNDPQWAELIVRDRADQIEKEAGA